MQEEGKGNKNKDNRWANDWNTCWRLLVPQVKMLIKGIQTLKDALVIGTYAANAFFFFTTMFGENLNLHAFWCKLM